MTVPSGRRWLTRTKEGRCLRNSGISLSPEPAQRKADNLLQKRIDVNVEEKLLHHLPAVAQVQNWIDQAKVLPRAVSH